MKNFTLLFFFLVTFASTAFSQTRTITGRVLDPSTKDALIGASIVVKGSTVGTTTDINGNFTLSVPDNTKVLTISYVGYNPKDVTLGAGNILSVNLESTSVVTNDVTVTTSRTAETIKQSSIQIEKMGVREIKNSASGDFYQNISNFKGIDLVTSSFGFKVLNLRGFSGTNSGRSLQLIDGIDNQAPGLNFPLGNLVGINDLDLQSVEVVSGAASALYGANAMQGVINMTSKSPWDVQGLALQIKGGATTVPAPYVEAQFRYAQVFGKKQNWAFKVTGSYMQTKDWDAGDSTFNRYGNISTRQDVSAILRKKALDPLSPTYTQEDKDKLVAVNNWLDFNPVANPGNLDINAPGYMERQMTNYKTYSLKLAGELHYKITNDIDLSYTGKFGMGSAVYQSVSRYQLKDIIFHQHKIELKGKNFVVRAYMSADDAGNSYDIRRTAQYISRATVPDYITKFTTSYFDSLRVYTDGFKADNEAKNWMADSARKTAIAYAATGWQPAHSAKFDSLYKVITGDPRGKLGTKFIDHSALYHIEAQYNFLSTKHVDLIAGANYRAYLPNSQGTIFSDSLINKGDTLPNGFPNPKGRYARIVVQDFGGYAQATAKLWKDHIKLVGSLRVDKNSNYKAQVSPRGAVVLTFGNHTFRIGASTGFKSPSLQNQYLNLDLGVISLIGNKDGQKNLYTYQSVLDSKAYNDSTLLTDPNHLTNAVKLLKPITLDPLKPEQVTSVDFGYRGEFFKKRLYIDLAGYYSVYRNFIGFTRVVRPQTGTAGQQSGEDDITASFYSPVKAYTLYQIDVNAKSTVPAWGASVSVSYYAGRGIQPYVNYTYADLKESNLNNSGSTVLSGFNAPHHKFNIGVIGVKVYKGLGFSANFKWVNSYRWQSSFADGIVPAFHTLDLQLSYELDKYFSTVRVGASNVYDNKHIEAAGSPKIGALYYVSWTFDFNKFKFMTKGKK